jgi:hypothetical protein
MAFDWKSLIEPGLALGGSLLGQKISGGNNDASIKESGRQFDATQQNRLQDIARADAIRRMAMPGALTNLGYGPAQAQSMTAAYPGAQPQLGAGTPYNFTGSSQQQQQSGGPGIGKKLLGAGLNAGTGIAAGALLGKVGLGGAAAGAGGGGMLGAMGALASNPFTIAGAGALAAGLLWKKSQAHHEANDWVQGNQNPFDNTMTSIDKAVQAGQMDPMQAQQTKMTNAKNYIAELNKFAQQGSDQRKVAGQALQTFVQHYGDPAQYGVAITF